MHKRKFLYLVTSMGVALVGAGALAYAASIRTVDLNDQCDPDTFNAAVGPGTCTGQNGGVSFDVFLNQLAASGHAGAWHFAPGVVSLCEGDAVQARNTEGEMHTFTKVAQFGGGFVDLLNQLSRNPEPAPECNPATNPDIQFVAPGQQTDPDASSTATSSQAT
jgi:hypothetical protein